MSPLRRRVGSLHPTERPQAFPISEAPLSLPLSPVKRPKTRPGMIDALTAGFLDEPRIVSFVERVRAREGITPPETRGDLKHNLRTFRPDDYLPAARRRVERVLLSDRDLLPQPPASNLPSLQELPPGLLAQAVALGNFVADASGLEPLLDRLSRVVARYIVVGLLEVPQVSVDTGGAVFTDFSSGEPIVIAMATAATDLADIVRLFRKQWREQFLTRQRDRAPDTLTQGLWLRHCRRVLEREADPEGWSYRRLAELSFHIWPKTRPRGKELDPAYERALDKRAEQIRKSMEAVDAWKLEAIGPSDETLPPET